MNSLAADREGFLKLCMFGPSSLIRWCNCCLYSVCVVLGILSEAEFECARMLCVGCLETLCCLRKTLDIRAFAVCVLLDSKSLLCFQGVLGILVCSSVGGQSPLGCSDVDFIIISSGKIN